MIRQAKSKKASFVEASLLPSETPGDLVGTLRIVMRDRIAKPQLPLIGGDERADHRMLFGDIAQWPAINLAKPEQEAADV